MPGHTLKISGLSSAVSEETVRTVFSTFGKVIESRKESKGNKGERATTFVTFVPVSYTHLTLPTKRIV